nr:MAG TPA: hypothetical protein [Caudoviricetes sp.]DAW78566.1 MAG TPA: hypothetical protein [Caudoviricetes sp.]
MILLRDGHIIRVMKPVEPLGAFALMRNMAGVLFFRRSSLCLP